MERSLWRFFPHILGLAMGLVFAVNFYFIYVAMNSFPGAAGADGFDLSNRYDRVLQTAAEQTALGWHVQAETDAARRPVLHLLDRAGQTLANVTVQAHAVRPLGPEEPINLEFNPAGAGIWQSNTTLFSGQWDLFLTVHAGSRQYSTTQRLVVR